MTSPQTADPARDLAPLLPLAWALGGIVRGRTIRLGVPHDVDSLVDDLVLAVAVHVQREVLPRTPGLAAHMAEVDAERQRQLAKWGDQRHPDGTGHGRDVVPGWTAGQLADAARSACGRFAGMGVVSWRDILGEEVCEALAADDPAELRAELVQCAAVIAAWVADLDRRAGDGS